jgi:serine/threonine protein kinase
MRLVENAVVAGRFRLNHLLQRGGMGSVWHATHLGLDIPCALKFVKGELLENEDVVSRFEREAKAAAQLRSPHVVQILDHGVCDGTPYMAMELLDGEDLGARLKRLGHLEPENLHEIVSGVCRALSRAHALGIVHRDLKPGNIFLVRDDDREIAKVLDFGIAKTNKANEVLGGGTKTGAMLGTPYYMSPEQAQGTKLVDFRSDLWSLAIICFQCLTGKLPFVSEALGDLLVKIIVSPIPIPSQVAAVPPGFDKWWAKAANREPSERFQSAKELSDALAIVCGISHVSSVIDRSPIHIESAALGRGAPASAAATLKDAGPNLVETLDRPLPNTTRVLPTQPSPQPIAADGNGVGSPGQATPSPLARSFVAEALPAPRQSPAAAIAIAAAGIVLVGVLLGVGWFAFLGRKTPPATASDTQSTPVPTATSSVPPPTPGTSATAPAAPASSPASEGTPPVATATATTSVPTVGNEPDSPKSQSGQSGESPHVSSHGRPSTTAKPTPKSGAKPLDMGF